MNGNWRYALFVTAALLLLAGHATAASVSAPAGNLQTVQSGKLEILYSFCDPNKPDCTGGYYPSSLIRGSDGALYGVTFTTIFRFDPATRKFSILETAPVGALYWIRAARDGGFYGRYGTGLFRLSPSGQFTVQPVFCSDEWSVSFPATPGVEDSQGNIYGTSESMDVGPPGPRGASHRDGNCLSGSLVYKVAPDGSFESLHRFSSFETPLLMAPDGNLYGLNNEYYGGSETGALYRVTPDGVYTELHTFDETVDGGVFDAPLVLGRDGMLYGNSRHFKTPDGTYLEGTLFRSTLDGQVTTLYVSHVPLPNGLYLPPDGNEIANMTLMPDGYFYGAYSTQGEYYKNNGTIFRTAIAGGTTALYHFDGPDSNPIVVTGPLVRGSDNALYGVTHSGGKYGWGMLFRYVPPPVQ